MIKKHNNAIELREFAEHLLNVAATIEQNKIPKTGGGYRIEIHTPTEMDETVSTGGFAQMKRTGEITVEINCNMTFKKEIKQ